MNIKWSLFPKSYQHLDLHGLAALVHEVGLDTVNMVMRDGFWVDYENYPAQTKVFVDTMRKEGVKIHFCTACISAGKLHRDDRPMAVMAENGITEFRLAQFYIGGRYAGRGEVRKTLKQARRDMELLVPHCEKHGLRAIYQTHQETLCPSPSSVWSLIEGLPNEHIGAMLDPGNQAFEGLENWHRSAVLLGEYLVAMGIKDTAVAHDPKRIEEPGKGWSRGPATLYEGDTNWYEVAAALKSIDFNGTFVFMPFYDSDKPDEMTAKLKREVAYLRKVVREVETLEQ